jgi:hypothetical protein
MILTEEAIMNPDYMGCYMKDYRRFRIEYGFECSCPEGVIYLPRHVDPQIVEDFLENFIYTRHVCLNHLSEEEKAACKLR